MIAGARSSAYVIDSIEPLKELFATLFFVSIGALMDIGQIPLFILPAIVIISATVSAKVLGVSLSVKAFGYPTGTAVRSGLGMAQIGEFSFIVVKVGTDANAVSTFLFPLTGVVVIITSLITPYLMKLGIHLESKNRPPEPHPTRRGANEPTTRYQPRRSSGTSERIWSSWVKKLF